MLSIAFITTNGTRRASTICLCSPFAAITLGGHWVRALQSHYFLFLKILHAVAYWWESSMKLSRKLCMKLWSCVATLIMHFKVKRWSKMEKSLWKHFSWREDAVWLINYFSPTFSWKDMCVWSIASFSVNGVPSVSIDSVMLQWRSLPSTTISLATSNNIYIDCFVARKEVIWQLVFYHAFYHHGAYLCTLAPTTCSMPVGSFYVIPLLFYCIFVIFSSNVFSFWLIVIVDFNEIFVQCQYQWSRMPHSIQLSSTLHGMSWGVSCSRFPSTGTGVKKKSGASSCGRWQNFLVA